MTEFEKEIIELENQKVEALLNISSNLKEVSALASSIRSILSYVGLFIAFCVILILAQYF